MSVGRAEARRWNGVPEATATIEWTVPKLLDALGLHHHEGALKGLSFADLQAMPAAEVKKLLPVGPAVKVLRKLRDIGRSQRDSAEFRGAGVHLGRPQPPTDDGGPVYVPQVELARRAQKKAEPKPDANDLLFGGDVDALKFAEQMGGKRRSTITVVPKFVSLLGELPQQPLQQTPQQTVADRERRVTSNFFDIFDLKPAAKRKGEALGASSGDGTFGGVGGGEEEHAPSVSPRKDVLNMQLSTETNKLQVVSGSFSDILDCVTFYVNIEDEFLSDMLFTHRYFSTTRNLIAGFKAHYSNTLKVGASAATPEEKRSAGKIMEQVQARLEALLEHWIENHFYFFDDNPELLKCFRNELVSCAIVDAGKVRRFNQLCDSTSAIRAYRTVHRSSKASVAKVEVIAQLFRDDKSGLVMDRRKNLRLYKQAFVAVEAINLVMRKLKLSDREVAVSLLDTVRETGAIQNAIKGPEASFEDGDSLWQFTAQPKPPPPREDTASGQHASVLDLDAATLAEQLTLIEFECFQEIVPVEMSHQAWSKNEGANAPNVMKLIRGFNETTYWVATEVVQQTKVDARLAVLCKMIEMADRCHRINNFQTLMEILVGLSMGPVSRLTQTWEALPAASSQTFQRLQKLIDNRKNYDNYRKALKEASLPCFPYVGLVLKDLTFIEDGNESFLDDKKAVINFQKMHMIGRMFAQVQRFQQSPYEFEVKPVLSAWLRAGRKIAPSDDELYALSFQCQPKKA